MISSKRMTSQQLQEITDWLDPGIHNLMEAHKVIMDLYKEVLQLKVENEELLKKVMKYENRGIVRAE